MTFVRTLKELLAPLDDHRKTAALGFVAGAVLWLTVGTLWPKTYEGSALVTLNLAADSDRQPNSVAGVGADAGLNAGDQAQPSTMANRLSPAAGRLDWDQISKRYHPYPEILTVSGPARIAAYLASQVSIEAADPGLGEGVARIQYAGGDRNVVLGVVTDVAAGLAAPTIPVRSSVAPAPPSQPLYAPVILPAATVVAQPKKGWSSKRLHGQKRHARPAAPASGNAAEVSAGLRASLASARELEDALNEKTAALDGLREELQARQTRSQSAAPPPVSAAARSTASSERTPSPQEERLRQDIARAQRELAALRERYTDEYPDVVNATARVRELLEDMSRISASAAQAPVEKSPQPGAIGAQAGKMDLGPLLREVNEAEAAQAKAQQEVERNQNETAGLRAKLAAMGQPANAELDGAIPPISDASPALTGEVPTVPATTNHDGDATASPDRMVAPFLMLRQPEVETQPWILAAKFLWPFSLVFGSLVALLAAWFRERRDPSIRSENMLRHELPASAVYLGGIPRIRHEVIAD